jgi:hypothetical protein
VVTEASLVGLLGALGSFPVYAAIVGLAALKVKSQTGLALNALGFHPVLLGAPLATVALAAFAGLLPAGRAYQIPVARSLSEID